MHTAPLPPPQIVLPPHLARELASLRAQRNFLIAAALSLLLHVGFVNVTPKREIVSGGVDGPTSLDVTLLPPATPADAPAEPAADRAPPVPRPQRVPPDASSPPRPPTVARTETVPPLLTAPQSAAPAVAEPPAADSFAAMLEARRARRAAEEAVIARSNVAYREAESGLSTGDAAKTAFQRNVQTFTRRGEVGGVFEILQRGARFGQFAFRGWRPEAGSGWKDVIEVDAGLGGDVDRAIVKRMIALIRTHYTGDFRWESHRLGRVIVLSARSEDNAGLEDFLIKEFFPEDPRRP